ncbi:hypothetical protein [Thiolapillus sp.]|nr:hypothetical protein [Thiolapillus sp.]
MTTCALALIVGLGAWGAYKFTASVSSAWSPSTTQQLRKLVAAPYLAPI